MPTKTFFNLPDYKREKLMDAIRTELSRTSVDELSINKIIHTAEIPRGSFYQYFENKNDMLFYLLLDYRVTLFDCARESLQNNGGDLFQTLIDIFDFTYSFVMEDHLFFKNLFSDIRIDLGFLARETDESIFQGFTAQLTPYINETLLDIRQANDLENMCDLLLLVTSDAFATTFLNTSQYLEIRSKYIARLELLKRSFEKTKQ